MMYQTNLGQWTIVLGNTAASINVIVGALILKELDGLIADEVMEACSFDYHYLYIRRAFQTEKRRDSIFQYSIPRSTDV
ncbi:hypothetical protein [Eubacterium aggregans]|uniref:hypothetical protein n=1 Tax=Eubacterium aggregans TaxID=81409 RepID=UPI003F2E630B